MQYCCLSKEDEEQSMRDLRDCMDCNPADWAISWVIIVSLHKLEVPWCGEEEASCEVLCFNKSRRFVHTVGMLGVYLQSQHLGSLSGAPAGPMQNSAGDVQTHGERHPGSTAFLWVETRGFEGHDQSLGPSVARTRFGSSWSIFYNMVFTHLWLLIIPV